MGIIDMRQERAGIWEQMKSLHERATAEKRALTAEEREQWDRMDSELNSLKERIDREERAAQVQAELAASVAPIVAHRVNEEGQPRALTATPEYRDAFRAYLVGGIGRLEHEQRQLLQKGLQRLEGAEVRALGVGAGPAGGFSVADEAMAPIINAMQAFGGIRAANTTKVVTETGADMPVPMTDDSGNEGVRVGEHQPVPERDMVQTQKILRAHAYSSRMVRASYQFLHDTSIENVEQWIGTQLGTRIGRIVNREMTEGLGAGAMPEGLLTASAFGAQTVGVGAIVYADLVELEHSVDPLYRIGAQWMMNDQVVKEIKQLVDLQNRPVWVPGIALREPDTILGYQYVVNQHFPAPGAGGWVGGERAIAFGAMSSYWVRDVRGITLIRLDERYAELGEVAFLAFSRHDGALMDAGTHPIRHLEIQTKA